MPVELMSLLLQNAKTVAQQFIDEIKASCLRVEVAGSVRRGKEKVKDIEIVAMPRYERVLEHTAFGFDYQTAKETDLLQKRITELHSQGKLVFDRKSKDGKEAPRGPRYYRITYEIYPIDLFVVLWPANWGIIYAIRTGSKEFNISLMTRALQLGMKVNSGRLFKLAEGKILRDEILCPEEVDFFKALGMEWIEPSKREVQKADEEPVEAIAVLMEAEGRKYIWDCLGCYQRFYDPQKVREHQKECQDYKDMKKR